MSLETMREAMREAGLSSRIAWALLRHGISLDAAARMSNDELLDYRNIGVKALKEIRQAVALTWGNTYLAQQEDHLTDELRTIDLCNVETFLDDVLNAPAANGNVMRGLLLTGIEVRSLARWIKAEGLLREVQRQLEERGEVPSSRVVTG